MRIRICTSLLRAAVLFVFCWILLQPGTCFGQTMDEQSSEAFYIKLLSQGEQSFLAADYGKALKELEIAAFGLFRQNMLLGKAYILMALSYSHLDEAENAAHSLREAFRWINKDEYRELELNIGDSDRGLLDRLIEETDVWEEVPEEEETAPSVSEKKTPIPQAETEKKSPPTSVKERIARLLAERKKQEETPKEKKAEETGQETEQKVDPEIKEKEDPTKGLEPLFETVEAPENFLLSEIWIKKEDDVMQVDLLFSPYTSHRLFEIKDPLPERLVIDIHNISGIKAGQKIAVNDFGVSAIRTGMYEAKTARVVFDVLGALPHYSVEITDDGLRVIIRKPVG